MNHFADRARKRLTTIRYLVVACLLSATSAEAQRFKYQDDGVALWARLSISSQVARFNTDIPSRDVDTWRHDASLRFNGEWVSENALIYGLRLEYDSDSHTAEALQRDEIYAYFVADFGRVELGEQDGPADRLAFHAPIIGLGQIRGDFARYAGRQALLSAYDTSDATKLIYLSPPTGGLRYGISYSPERTANTGARRARDRTQQENAIELGVQYQQPLSGWVDGWIGGLSGGYVSANAEAMTERADIDSWSAGAELKRGRLTLGCAYVWRGDSNLRTRGYDQEEVNLGFSWRGRQWKVAMSGSRTTSSRRNYNLMGVGVWMKLTAWINGRADLVRYDESTASNGKQDATVLLAELEVKI